MNEVIEVVSTWLARRLLFAWVIFFYARLIHVLSVVNIVMSLSTLSQ